MDFVLFLAQSNTWSCSKQFHKSISATSAVELIVCKGTAYRVATLLKINPYSKCSDSRMTASVTPLHWLKLLKQN